MYIAYITLSIIPLVKVSLEMKKDTVKIMEFLFEVFVQGQIISLLETKERLKRFA